ncbi:NAD-dependent epimerase/dehydratase family protein [Patescibacteria group bacterium]
MENVLITGANGFIGKHVCEKLHGYNIVPLFCKTTDFDELCEEIKEEKIDYVLHLGSHVNLEKSYEKAKKTIDENILGTVNLLEAVKDKGVKRFIFFSTEEVYGNNKPPYSEEMLPDPTSPYAISKLCSEHYCKLYGRLYDMPYTVLRVSYVYGFGQKEERLIPYLFRELIRNKEVVLNADSQKRDFIYIDDLIDAIRKVMASEEAANQIINIGDIQNHYPSEIAEQIKSITKSSGNIRLSEEQVRKGEAEEWSLSTEKARRILKWKPRTDMHEGMRVLSQLYKN